jgi:acyl CoA:acetate/3-ketoacid CoA transferase alpha subunit
MAIGGFGILRQPMVGGGNANQRNFRPLGFIGGQLGIIKTGAGKLPGCGQIVGIGTAFRLGLQKCFFCPNQKNLVAIGLAQH